MPTLLDIKAILRSHKARLSAKYGVDSIAIFGNYSRGQEPNCLALKKVYTILILAFASFLAI
ncbi:MAG: hypothetical protein BGO32_03520 [Bacteroidetes bacterium 37-13]|nr:MAG: hypothetical protein BGO32_03520 [Bacteroidetes bacterium 37-13]